MRPIALAALLYAVATTALAANAPEPGLYRPVELQAGVWDAEIQFFDPATGQANGGAKGVQTNVLLGDGHWVTNDLVVHGPAGAAAKPAFQGHGVWGWDPVAKQYVDTWVDTNDGAVRTDFGHWNAETRTMFWTALQPDGQGHSVNYRMTEAYDSDTQRTLTFYQVALQSGRLVKLAEMHFTRRAR
ncbi:DUF1579 family protein [Ideonella sp.]|uniref:DUF1579 family protein n=1 Tax=Ideonella sp. TaxID=1929293 RepID=UPI0035AFF795